MKIINKTHWRTDHLKSIISRALIDELDVAARTRVVCTVTYTRGYSGGSCSGHAYYGTPQLPARNMRISVPKTQITKTDLAMVAAHEAAHLRGMKHRTMRGNPRYRRIQPRTSEIYAWADSYPLECKPVKIAPDKAAVTSKKLLHAIRQLKKATTRMKRAATIVKKWEKKVRYYQKQTITQLGETTNNADDSI